MNFKVLISALCASMIVFAGCSDDTGGAGSGGSGGMGGTGGTGGTGGGIVPKTCEDVPQDITGYIVEGAPTTATDDCTITLNPTGDNDQAQIINALVENDLTNGTLCLGVGVWDMGNTIDITEDPGLTIKGIGDSPDEVVLDYADENFDCRGDKGISAGVDNVTIENLWVKNTCANGVEQRDVDGSVFRKVIVSWDDRCEGDRARPNCGQACTEDANCEDPLLVCGDAGTCVNNMTANGAYGVYPTDCSNTIVEYNQVQGASDAGIYIGKCTGGTVENNIVYENVAGLEVENCVNVDASKNTAFDNTGGMFALQQDITASSMQSNTGIRLFDNESYCNNHPNFAKQGSAVSGIPVGSGILNLAGDGVEISGNLITDNLTLGVAMVGNILFCQLAGGGAASGDCPPYSDGYDPYAKNYYIHDNLFTNNGTDPQGDVGLLLAGLGLVPVADVVWDGYKESPEADAGICLGTDAGAAASILVFGDDCQTAANTGEFITCVSSNQPTDQAAFLCAP